MGEGGEGGGREKKKRNKIIRKYFHKTLSLRQERLLRTISNNAIPTDITDFVTEMSGWLHSQVPCYHENYPMTVDNGELWSAYGGQLI